MERTKKGWPAFSNAQFIALIFKGIHHGRCMPIQTRLLLHIPNLNSKFDGLTSPPCFSLFLFLTLYHEEHRRSTWRCLFDDKELSAGLLGVCYRRTHPDIAVWAGAHPIQVAVFRHFACSGLYCHHHHHPNNHNGMEQGRPQRRRVHLSAIHLQKGASEMERLHYQPAAVAPNAPSKT